jgi:hypothetical protein
VASGLVLLQDAERVLSGFHGHWALEDMIRTTLCNEDENWHLFGVQFSLNY